METGPTGSNSTSRAFLLCILVLILRLQALAVLMLHYCAGLQNCVDMEEANEEGEQEAHEDVVAEISSEGVESGSTETLEETLIGAQVLLQGQAD